MQETLVSKGNSSKRRNSEEKLLEGELAHRMNNELAAAIAVVSLAAARSPSSEVKSALGVVEAALHSYVKVNRCLQRRLKTRLLMPRRTFGGYVNRSAVPGWIAG